jgi:hypothetical protein
MAKVFGMLRSQPQATVLSGGLDARLVDDWVVSQLKTLRINQLFLAADIDAMLPAVRRAATNLSFLPRRKLRCYVLIGKDETLEQSERRLEAVWDIGCMPFAQLFQPADHYVPYGRDWRLLAKKWSRPAAMVASHSPRRNHLPTCGKCATLGEPRQLRTI